MEKDSQQAKETEASERSERSRASETDAPLGGTALLLMGGGARAAYGIGLLRCVARRIPEKCDFSVIGGVSAGAINAAYLASRAGSLRERTDGLTDLWRNLHASSVMEIATSDLLQNIAVWSAQLIGGGASFLPTARGLVDCTPLRSLLRRELTEGGNSTIHGIDERLRQTSLRSVLLSTTSYATGQAVVWSQGAPVPETWTRPLRRSQSADLTIEHVVASAALPLIFPAVKLGEEWHGDGDIGLTSPLSPLVALGVERILAVSTHRGPKRDAGYGAPSGYPAPGQVAGTVLDSAVLYHLESDARKLRRVNRLLGQGTAEGTKNGDGGTFRKVDLFILRPSRDLGSMAEEYESQLPWAFRHMIRGLGTHSSIGTVLSMLSFEPEYLQALIAAGEEDAEQASEGLEAFLSGAP